MKKIYKFSFENHMLPNEKVLQNILLISIYFIFSFKKTTIASEVIMVPCLIKKKETGQAGKIGKEINTLVRTDCC